MSPTLVAIIVQAAIQYGIPFAQQMIALMKKQNVTLDELDALLASVKPYEAYGIPDIAPKTPTP